MKQSLSLLFILFLFKASSGQPGQMTAQEYIARYKNVAIEEMVRCKIPASITLAQGLHESSCGKSPLSCNANNHFGIKCKEEWEGKKYYHDDDSPQECFRVYDHAEASYADHSDFLITRPRYAGLFELPLTDYKSWAIGLKAAGYATNPKYAQILISTIEENNLSQYDQVGIGMIQEREQLLYPGQTQQPVQASNIKAEKAPVSTAAKEKEKSKPVNVIIESIIAANPVTPENTRKEYVVNGMRALRAKGNEDPLKIAFDYNIDYSYILAFNDLASGEHFKDGENIFLQAKRNRGAEDKYTVSAGESMRDISQKFGIKLSVLYAKNEMKPNDQVIPGETVYLQEKRNESPRTMVYADYLKTLSSAYSPTKVPPNGPESASTKPIQLQNQYEVQQSDTLYSIARKFNMSVEELKALNNLQDLHVKAGQTLVVAK